MGILTYTLEQIQDALDRYKGGYNSKARALEVTSDRTLTTQEVANYSTIIVRDSSNLTLTLPTPNDMKNFFGDDKTSIELVILNPYPGNVKFKTGTGYYMTKELLAEYVIDSSYDRLALTYSINGNIPYISFSKELNLHITTKNSLKQPLSLSTGNNQIKYDSHFDLVKTYIDPSEKLIVYTADGPYLKSVKYQYHIELDIFLSLKDGESIPTSWDGDLEILDPDGSTILYSFPLKFIANINQPISLSFSRDFEILKEGKMMMQINNVTSNVKFVGYIDYRVSYNIK